MNDSIDQASNIFCGDSKYPLENEDEVDSTISSNFIVAKSPAGTAPFDEDTLEVINFFWKDDQPGGPGINYGVVDAHLHPLCHLSIKRNEIISDSDYPTVVCCGHDKRSDLYIGFGLNWRSNKQQVGWIRKFPVKVSLGWFRSKTLSYIPSQLSDIKLRPEYHLVTNPKRYVLEWKKIIENENYVRKNTKYIIYPKVLHEMFGRVTVKSEGGKLCTIPAAVWPERLLGDDNCSKSNVVLYTMQTNGGVDRQKFTYDKPDDYYELLYINLRLSAVSLLQLELMDVKYDSDRLAGLQTSSIEFYSSERIENSSLTPIKHVFESTQANYNEVSNTMFIDTVGGFDFNLTSKLFGPSILGINFDADYRSQTTSSNGSISQSTEVVRILREVDIAPNTWIQIKATADSLDNVQIPYKASYIVKPNCDLDSGEIKQLLTAVGYEVELVMKDNQFIMEVDGELLVKGYRNINIVASGGILES